MMPFSIVTAPTSTRSGRTSRALARHRSPDPDPSWAVAREADWKGEFMTYSRFAIYYLPPAGPLAEFGARWLGWDVENGRALRQPDLPGLEGITKAPRKYGFHGTLKPPFRLAQG